MKHILLSLLALLITVALNAQSIKVYKNNTLVTIYIGDSNYNYKALLQKNDANQNCINILKKGTTETTFKTVATYTNSSTETYKAVIVPTVLMSGEFSVSATKKVLFTNGNLYWDGSAFMLEEKQTDYPTSWNTNHVGHFFWTSATDNKSGTADYMPYAASYSHSSSDNTFWCGEANPLTVEGTEGLYVLSPDEWNYLLTKRTNASSLYKMDVAVGSGSNKVEHCLIIAPDGFSGTLQQSYDTSDAVTNLGLVCLPPAGSRGESSGEMIFSNVGVSGYYCSSSRSNESIAYFLQINSTAINPQNNGHSSYGRSIRLVYNK